MAIASFDIFDSTLITNRIFGLQNFSPVTLNPYTSRLNDAGYSQTNFILNMGSMFYTTSFILSIYLLTVILHVLNKLV